MATVAELLRPNRYASHQEDDFVVFRDVPVWKEHVNRHDFAQPVEFDRAALQRICDRCNERIEDTGDHAVLIVRHNDDSGEYEPPVVGYAGPFRMGMVGRKDPKHAILADFRVYKEDAERVKRYPRVSVEYMASKRDPKGGYFDSIALLGSEAPELDLGIRYSARHAGRDLVRACYSSVRINYQAAAPGGANVFVPGGTAIVDDDEQTTPYQKGSPMPLSPEDLNQIVDALGPVIEAKVSQMLPSDPNMMDGEDEQMTPYQNACKYMADGDEDGLREMLAGLDDEGRQGLLADADADQDEQRAQYMKELVGGTDDTGSEAPGVAAYKKRLDDSERTVARYRRERDEIKAKYEKVVRENAGMKAELDVLRDDNRKKARYQKLKERQDEGYVFDLDDELEDTKNFSDAQFDRHVEKTIARYQRVPRGGLPTERPEQYEPPAEQSEEDKVRATYAKKAQQYCLAEREKGHSISYAEALEAVKQNPELVPA